VSGDQGAGKKKPKKKKKDGSEAKKREPMSEGGGGGKGSGGLAIKGRKDMRGEGTGREKAANVLDGHGGLH